VVGLILGGILGFAVGLLSGMVFIKPEEKRSIKKESKAERIFNLAIQQEDRKKKLELLGKILDKYPKSEKERIREFIGGDAKYSAYPIRVEKTTPKAK